MRIEGDRRPQSGVLPTVHAAGFPVNPAHIPLFPLHTVLFPGGPLPLRIFEPRYLRMIGDCLKSDSCFGVCLISDGREVGEAATPYPTGTTARIVDWHQRHDGLLGITARGERRFRVLSREVQANQLTLAKVELLPEDGECDVPEKYLPLTDLLRRVLEQAGHHYADLPRRFGDAAWVGYRLSELLPLSLPRKQYLLEIEDPVARLEQLFGLLEGMEID